MTAKMMLGEGGVNRACELDSNNYCKKNIHCSERGQSARVKGAGRSARVVHD
jgi:hypothetical protein